MIFRRKKPAPIDTRLEYLSNLTISDIIHRFLLDSRISEAQQLSTLLGLKPMVAEQAVEEQSESDARVLHAQPLVPILYMFSSAIAGSVTEYLQTMSATAALSEDEAAAMADLLHKMCLSTALGTVTQLEDLGLIRYSYSG